MCGPERFIGHDLGTRPLQLGAESDRHAVPFVMHIQYGQLRSLLWRRNVALPRKDWLLPLQNYRQCYPTERIDTTTTTLVEGDTAVT